MNDAFPEASVTGYEPLITTLSNDEGDRHVLAAAIRTQAQYIVTENVRHFPAAATEPFEIRAITADTFLLELCEAELARHCLGQTIIRQSENLRRPQLTARQVLRVLRRHIPLACQMIEDYLELTQPRVLDESWASGTQL